jgi:hypothetical protein
MSISAIIKPDENGNSPVFVSQSDSYAHFAGANAGTSIKNGAGTLRKVVVNTKGTTATLTLYDNTSASGTVIAVLDLTAQPGTFMFDAAFTIGCFAVITGTLSDVTITYR